MKRLGRVLLMFVLVLTMFFQDMPVSALSYGTKKEETTGETPSPSETPVVTPQVTTDSQVQNSVDPNTDADTVSQADTTGASVTDTTEQTQQPEQPAADPTKTEAPTYDSESDSDASANTDEAQQNDTDSVNTDADNGLQTAAKMNLNGLSVSNTAAETTYVTGVTISIDSDGTAPFDADNERGNDNSKNNNKVRSYDQVTYNVSQSFEAQSDVDVTGKKVFYSLTVPNDPNLQLDAKASGISESEATAVPNADNSQKTYTFSFPITTNDATGSGGRGRQIVFDVLGMHEGQTFAPVVKCWIDGNEENKDPSGTVQNGNTATAPTITVTSVPAYNIILKRGGIAGMDNFKFNSKESKNFLDTSLATYQATDYGTAQTVSGYAITWGVAVEMRKKDKEKGIRGMEYPDPSQPLTFDVDIGNANYTHVNTITNTATTGWTPLLYRVRKNSNNYNDHISSNDIPASDTSLKDDASKACKNSGNYTVTQEGNTLHFSISNYKIDPSAFPKTPFSGTPQYYNDPKQIKEGVFTSAQFTVVYPMINANGNDVRTQYGGNGNYSFVAKADNLSAKSVNGTEVGNNQTIKETIPLSDAETDNTSDMPVNQVDGHGYTQEVYFSSDPTKAYKQKYNFSEGSDNSDPGSMYNKGNDSDSATQGSDVYFNTTWNESNTSNLYPVNGRIVAVDQLVLMQGDTDNNDDVFDIRQIGTQTYQPGGSSDHGYYLYPMYVTANHVLNFEQTKSIKMDVSNNGLSYYEDKSKIPADQHVVGILLRWRGISYVKDGNGNGATQQNKTYAKIKSDTYSAGKVYSITVQSKLFDTSILPDVSTTGDADTDAEAYRNAAVNQLLDTNGPLCLRTTKPNPIKTIDSRDQYTSQPSYGSAGYTHEKSQFSRDRADSLYVVPFYTEITKTVAQSDQNGNEKNAYNLDLGERYADYKLTSSLQFADSGMSFDNGERTTTITIKDTIPKGLTYVKGSAVLGPSSYKEVEGKPGIMTGGTPLEPTSESGADNTTILTWTIDNVPVKNGDLPALYYTCVIDKDVNNNSDLKNTVTIQAAEEKRAICAANGNIDDAGIHVTKSTGFNINKYGDHDLELNDKATYTLVASNSQNAAKENFLLVDSMPYSNKNGTVKNGVYNVKNITIDSNSELISQEGINNISIYYTNDLKYAGETDITKFPVGTQFDGNTPEGWTKAEKKSEPGKNPSWNVKGWPTAIAIFEKKLGGNDTIQATIHYEATADKADHLYNYLLTEGEGKSTLSHNTDTVIYDRDLSGTVWIDDNFNGLMDDGEEKVSGVKVQLQRQNDNGDWVTVNTYTGTDGKEHQASTVTDENGFYRFDKLRKGTGYRVIFTSGNTLESDLSQYYMTNPNAGDDTTKTSKTNSVNGKVSEGDITGISMPTIEEMKADGKSHYSLPDQNMGLYRVRRTISGTAWFDANGDGIYQKDAMDDTKEYPMKGVEVSLYRKDKDDNYVPYKVSGKEVTTTTDDNGQYVFEKLPEGEYEVIFSDGKGHNAKISAFNVTLPDQGTDPGTRSIADAGKDGTAIVSRQNGSTDGIRLLSDQELIAGKQSLQTIDNLNAGFVPKPVDISVTKVWNDNSNQDGLRPDPETFRTALHLECFKAGQNGKATGDAEIIDAVAVVTDNRNNTYTVAYSNLLSVSYDGNEFTHYVYKVKEDAIDGYSADTAEAGNGEAMINTHKPAEPVNPPVTPDEPDTPDTPSVSPALSVTPETGKAPGDRSGKPSVSPSPKTKVKKNEAPDTGDHSNNGLYAGLLGLCVVFIVWRMLGIRKEHHND